MSAKSEANMDRIQAAAGGSLLGVYGHLATLWRTVRNDKAGKPIHGKYTRLFLQEDDSFLVEACGQDWMVITPDNRMTIGYAPPLGQYTMNIMYKVSNYRVWKHSEKYINGKSYVLFPTKKPGDKQPLLEGTVLDVSDLGNWKIIYNPHVETHVKMDYLDPTIRHYVNEMVRGLRELVVPMDRLGVLPRPKGSRYGGIGLMQLLDNSCERTTRQQLRDLFMVMTDDNFNSLRQFCHLHTEMDYNYGYVTIHAYKKTYIDRGLNQLRNYLQGYYTRQIPVYRYDGVKRDAERRYRVAKQSKNLGSVFPGGDPARGLRRPDGREECAQAA